MRLNFTFNNNVFSADLPASMSLADLAAYVEAETGLPPTHQTLIYKYTHLSPASTTTLEQSNIMEDDMIVILPFDPVQDNWQKAYEENPEFFADVTLLYIKVSLNGHDVPALVDTGAQKSIIAPELVEKCELTHLVDKRYIMEARGVGQQTSVGRIHSVPILMGSETFAASLTVLNLNGVPLLVGLDWMKSFKIKIDLDANGIFVGTTFVPFLNEWEIKQLQKSIEMEMDKKPESIKMATEPKVSSVKDAISSKATTAVPSVQQTLTPLQQQKLNNLMDMGFTREKSLNALKQCNWNVDMAGGLLFNL